MNSASNSCSSKKPSPFESGTSERHAVEVYYAIFDKRCYPDNKKITVQVEERFGVKIVRVEAVRFLPHLLELILTALEKTQHAQETF